MDLKGGHFHAATRYDFIPRHRYPPVRDQLHKKLERSNMSYNILKASQNVSAHYKPFFFSLPLLLRITITMSGTSNVGNSQVYEAGDQRTYKDSEIQQAKDENRFHEGKPNSHLAQDSSTTLMRCLLW